MNFRYRLWKLASGHDIDQLFILTCQYLRNQLTPSAGNEAHPQKHLINFAVIREDWYRLEKLAPLKQSNIRTRTRAVCSRSGRGHAPPPAPPQTLRQLLPAHLAALEPGDGSVCSLGGHQARKWQKTISTETITQEVLKGHNHQSSPETVLEFNADT